jgi:hypothetical protein
LVNRSGWFCPGNPEKTKDTKPEQNHLKTLPNLNKESHSLKETCLLETSLDSPLVTKPVRPVLLGQSGQTQPTGKNSPVTSIDLPIHSMDSSETLRKAGVPYGLPLDRSSSPKTHPIKRNRKSTLKNTFSRAPPKTTKLKSFHRDCWSKITKQRGTRSSYVTSNKNSANKRF